MVKQIIKQKTSQKIRKKREIKIKRVDPIEKMLIPTSS